jgi:transcriptional regulator with XRE-family HTH domain
VIRSGTHNRRRMEGLYREFGELLRTHRRQAGLTQNQVAERVGLARTSITNIERGQQHVPLHQLFRLASAVGVQPAELLPTGSAALEELVSPDTLRALRDGDSDNMATLARVLKHSPSSGEPAVEVLEG